VSSLHDLKWVRASVVTIFGGSSYIHEVTSCSDVITFDPEAFFLKA
jgi:hypothetical protein